MRVGLRACGSGLRRQFLGGGAARMLSTKIKAPPMVYISGEEMTKYTMDVCALPCRPCPPLGCGKFFSPSPQDVKIRALPFRRARRGRRSS